MTEPSWKVIVGDAREMLRTLPAGSAQVCISSPPYFGLRDYGTGEWEGGEPECDHRQGTRHQTQGANSVTAGRTVYVEGHNRNETFRDTCGKCGAARTDRQIGLEQTPDEYVAALVGVFREVRRVLRDDGTVWLNLGDSYCSTDKWGGGKSGNTGKHTTNGSDVPSWAVRERSAPIAGVKPKDLLGIPWLVAFALRADGWYLRSEVVWAKPNPMPESVRDRPTSAHEKLFLLAKQPRYFYDADAIREESQERVPWSARSGKQGVTGMHQSTASERRYVGFNARYIEATENGTAPGGRNKRNVWEIATQPYAEAHFATFPTALVEPCVLAGSSPKACGQCGAPWQRMVQRGESVHACVQRETGITWQEQAELARVQGKALKAGQPSVGGVRLPDGRSVGSLTPAPPVSETWEPSCAHDDDTGRCVVLDPFAGSGTVGVVCRWYGRDFVGVELNPVYAEMARQRIAAEGRLGRSAYRPEPPADNQLTFLP